MFDILLACSCGGGCSCCPWCLGKLLSEPAVLSAICVTGGLFAGVVSGLVIGRLFK